MKVHELKTDPEVWEAVDCGEKTFEVRNNDRNFQVGDIIHSRQTAYSGNAMKNEGFPLIYTGDEHLLKITYILHGPFYELSENGVIMSVVKI
jgi:hypothetical protein